MKLNPQWAGCGHKRLRNFPQVFFERMNLKKGHCSGHYSLYGALVKALLSVLKIMGIGAEQDSFYCLVCFSYLSKGPYDLKQKGTIYKKPFSCSFFHSLSNAVSFCCDCQLQKPFKKKIRIVYYKILISSRVVSGAITRNRSDHTTRNPWENA